MHFLTFQGHLRGFLVKVEVKVTTVISVENVELGVADREQVVAAKVIKYVRLIVDLCL
jgi:hypothetical protein